MIVRSLTLRFFFREDNTLTVVDMNIVLLATEEPFDESNVKRKIYRNMLEIIQDYDLGGCPVDITANKHPLTVGTPVLGR